MYYGGGRGGVGGEIAKILKNTLCVLLFVERATLPPPALQFYLCNLIPGILLYIFYFFIFFIYFVFVFFLGRKSGGVLWTTQGSDGSRRRRRPFPCLWNRMSPLRNALLECSLETRLKSSRHYLEALKRVYDARSQL